MLKFLSLSSGSCGNCYFLTDGKSSILIDAGVSVRRMRKALNERGFSLDSVRAVLVTHDHLDHIRHLGAYCKYLSLPTYATPTLNKALLVHTFTKDWIQDCKHDIEEGVPTLIPMGSDVKEEDCPIVRNFVVPHDASQTVGYFITWHGKNFFLMTDAGRMTDEAVSFASQADVAVVESNYDTGMLIGGPYTHELKMRICQGHGHLSNDECAGAIRRFWHPGLKALFLCHLSQNNNTPDLAFSASAEALKSIKVGDGLSAKEVTNLQTLPRSCPSAIFDI